MDKHDRVMIGSIAASIARTCRNFISANLIHQARSGVFALVL
jgi:hypothetical protein